ncbi:MAG: hypothetical protein ACJAYR_002142 [Sneathiella sp.]|jgi:hypothetical protein
MLDPLSLSLQSRLTYFAASHLCQSDYKATAKSKAFVNYKIHYLNSVISMGFANGDAKGKSEVSPPRARRMPCCGVQSAIFQDFSNQVLFSNKNARDNPLKVSKPSKN